MNLSDRRIGEGILGSGRQLPHKRPQEPTACMLSCRYKPGQICRRATLITQLVMLIFLKHYGVPVYHRCGNPPLVIV